MGFSFLNWPDQARSFRRFIFVQLSILFSFEQWPKISLQGKQQTRASVKLCIEETLDQLPKAYSQTIYTEKCEATYQHVYNNYFGSGESIYEKAA